MTLQKGLLLKNRYKITDVLGQGGMGAVYRAVDVHLEIEVAVKENMFLSDEYTRQFRREATILAGLRHASLPHVIDYFTLEGQGQYMVMDFILGEDLRQRMDRSGTLPELDAVLIGAAVCDALAYLHTRKPPIIHRDIKPGNVKITPEGTIVLVDFGLAKIMVEHQATITGARAMTPGYSPPEQYGTAHTDERSDIYSLAATLYASLTGVIPEDGLARATGSAELTSLHLLEPRINRRLAEVIEMALSIDPQERFQTAEEFKCALMDSLTSTRNMPGEIVVSPPPDPGSELAVITDSTPSRLPSLRKRRTTRTLRKVWRTGSNWLTLALLAVLLWSGANLLIQPAQFQQTLAAFLALPTPTSLPPTATAKGLPAVGIGSIPTNTPTLAPTATLTSTPTSSPTPEPTPFGGGSGTIAFVSHRTGIPQIWTMDAYGGSLQQITNVEDGACQPAWSPDGARLVFISPCQGRREIYERTSMFTINADGSGLQALPTSAQGDFDPAWSPDGQRIAFTSLRTGQPKVYILNLNDLSVDMISDSPYSDRNPSWSPSGMQLAFVRTRTAAQVWISTDNGSEQLQFTRSGDFNDLWPIWSPDGQMIFFSQTPKDRGIPWLMGLRYEDRGTSQAFRIPLENAADLGPAADIGISNDGHWLVYEGWPSGENHDIYRMTVTGASVQQLTTDPSLDYQPAWKP